MTQLLLCLLALACIALSTATGPAIPASGFWLYVAGICVGLVFAVRPRRR